LTGRTWLFVNKYFISRIWANDYLNKRAVLVLTIIHDLLGSLNFHEGEKNYENLQRSPEFDYEQMKSCATVRTRRPRYESRRHKNPEDFVATAFITWRKRYAPWRHCSNTTRKMKLKATSKKCINIFHVRHYQQIHFSFTNYI